MTTLHQALYGLALLGAMGLLLWGQQQRIAMADGRAELSNQIARTSLLAAEQSIAAAETLQGELDTERQAQQTLRTKQNQLRAGLAERNQQIEELKRENQALRDWAAQQLPDAARRLRERPAVTGADAYRDWLSGRSALPTSSDIPKQ